MATIRRIDNFDCTFLACKLSAAHIDDNWCHQISRALTGNDFLQQLYLSGNYITDSGAQSLADALTRNWALKILNISGNLITDEGAGKLGEMLRVNKHLVDLNLEFVEKKRPYRDKGKPYPKITAPGAAMIAFGLQGNFSLTSLNLSGQRIWDVGCVAIASMMRKNGTIKYLNLSDNDIKEQGGVAISGAVGVNEGMEHLNLSGNGFDDRVGEEMGKSLKVNRKLETVDLFENDMTLVGIRELREAAKGNPTLRVVSVYGNRGVGKRRNDPELDNLCQSNLKRWWEDKHIKNMVIWHKRLFEKGETRVDYDHFLEVRTGGATTVYYNYSTITNNLPLLRFNLGSLWTRAAAYCTTWTPPRTGIGTRLRTVPMNWAP